MGRRRGGGGGGGGTQIVQQNTNPWSGQQGYLTNLFNRAEGLYGATPRKFYPGATVAPFDPAELEAMRRGEARAKAGSPELNLTRGFTRGILSNDPATVNSLLGPKIEELLPYLRAGTRQGPGVGSLSRLAEQKLIQSELSKIRDREMDRAERLAGVDYQDFAQLAGIGETRRDMAQDLIDEQIARHEFGQNEPYQRLRDYQGFIQGGYGSEGGSTTIPMRGSRLSGLFGGALGGAGLGGMVGGAIPGARAGSTFGVPGALFGAGLGALAGLF